MKQLSKTSRNKYWSGEERQIYAGNLKRVKSENDLRSRESSLIKIVANYKRKDTKINQDKSSTVTTKEFNRVTTAKIVTTKYLMTNDIDRYIKRLKKLLKEKSLKSKIEVPALCQCNYFNDETLKNEAWDIDWNMCANNCLFYNNPKGLILFFYYCKTLGLFKRSIL